MQITNSLLPLLLSVAGCVCRILQGQWRFPCSIVGHITHVCVLGSEMSYDLTLGNEMNCCAHYAHRLRLQLRLQLQLVTKTYFCTEDFITTDLDSS